MIRTPSSDILLENMSDAVIVVDGDLRITLANGKATSLLRRPKRELVGQLFFNNHPELNNSAAERQLQAARASAVPTKCEIFIPGLFAWWDILAVPHEGGLILFCRDVTERARREQDQAVRESVRRIVENLPVCVTITRGREHRIELANALARALVGGRAIEGELLERVLPETREHGFIALLDGVMSSGTRYEVEERLFVWRPTPQAEEQRGTFNVVYQPIFDVAGGVTGVLHLGIEVTDTIRRRETLLRYAAEREAILQQLSEGVILTDAAGVISFVNAAAKRQHGVAVLDVAPNDYTATYNLLTEDGQPYPPEALPLAQAVQFNREVIGARWQIQRPDGTVISVEGSAKPVLAADGERIACVLTMHEVPKRGPDIPPSGV